MHASMLLLAARERAQLRVPCSRFTWAACTVSAAEHQQRRSHGFGSVLDGPSTACTRPSLAEGWRWSAMQ